MYFHGVRRARRRLRKKPKSMMSAVSAPSSAATPATTSSSTGAKPSRLKPCLSMSSMGPNASMIIPAAARMIAKPSVALRVPLMVSPSELLWKRSPSRAMSATMTAGWLKMSMTRSSIRVPPLYVRSSRVALVLSAGGGAFLEDLACLLDGSRLPQPPQVLLFPYEGGEGSYHLDVGVGARSREAEEEIHGVVLLGAELDRLAEGEQADAGLQGPVFGAGVGDGDARRYDDVGAQLLDGPDHRRHVALLGNTPCHE